MLGKLSKAVLFLLILSANELYSQDYLREGIAEFDRGNYVQAESLLTLSLSITPLRSDSIEALYFLGVIEPVAEAARIRLEKLLSKYPDNRRTPEVLLQLGIHRYSQQDYGGAEGYFRKIIRDYPASTQVHEAQLWLGRNYLAQNDARSAQIELNKGWSDLPASAIEKLGGDFLFYLGETAAKLGIKSEARRHFSNLRSQFPNHPLTTLALGKMESLNGGSSVFYSATAGTILNLDKPPSVNAMAFESSRTSAETMTVPDSITGDYYSLQVASFRVQRMAEDFAAKLNREGNKTTIKEVMIGSDLYYRILIGKYKTRADAEKDKVSLFEKGFKPYVIKVEVED